MVEQRSVPASVDLIWIEGDFLTYDFATLFDFVCGSAVVHHMPLDGALKKMAGLLRPGGTLALLGLYRRQTLTDRALDLPAVVVNAWHAWRRPAVPMGGPVKDPEMSLTEVRHVATTVLPGVKVRRLLMWRYLLVWTKPPG